MKKLIASAVIVLGLFACNNAEEKTKTGEGEQKKNAAMDNPDYDAGLNLAAKSDCFTCHKLREKLVGPAWGDVAKKYANTPENIELLSEKILKGGQGVWGTVPMAAHPGITKADAEKMVKYILLLKE
ncbi:MAG: c-type cytochrome [Ferruginibacter sp.]